MIRGPYLAYSGAVHGGLLIALFAAGRQAAVSRPQTYRIDFIGPSSTILNRNPDADAGKQGAAAKPTAGSEKIAPLNRDNFGRRRHAPLPKPSFLKRLHERAPTPDDAGGAQSSSPLAPSSGAKSNAPEGEASVSADMPNFPYPWYISQVRGSLWTQWSGRMPSGGGETVVQFTIMKNGAAVDIRVETSSGDESFDYIALGAVQDAAPFAPLPRGFADSFLKVHVRFKTQ